MQVSIGDRFFQILPTPANKFPCLDQWIKLTGEVLNQSGTLNTEAAKSCLKQLEYWAGLNDWIEGNEGLRIDLGVADHEELQAVLNAIALVNSDKTPEPKPEEEPKRKRKKKEQETRSFSAEEYLAYQISLLVNTELCSDFASALKIVNERDRNLVDQVINERIRFLNQSKSPEKKKEEKEEEIIEDVISDLADGSFFKGFAGAMDQLTS